MQSNEYLVILNIPPNLEEAMLDCLLAFEAADSFNSFPIDAHDHKNVGLSIVEQVSGRQKKICFQMFLPEDEFNKLKDILKQEFNNSGICYRVMPVVEQGYF